MKKVHRTNWLWFWYGFDEEYFKIILETNIRVTFLYSLLTELPNVHRDGNWEEKAD